MFAFTYRKERSWHSHLEIGIEAAAGRKCKKFNTETMKYKTDHLTAKRGYSKARANDTTSHTNARSISFNEAQSTKKHKHKDFSVFLRVFTQKRQHHDHSRFSVVRSALKQSMLDGKFVAVMYELLRAYFQKYNVLSHRRLGFQKMREKLLCCCIA